MKGITKVRYASSKSSPTLETSIPAEFINQLKLKAGEQLEWELAYPYKEITIKRID